MPGYTQAGRPTVGTGAGLRFARIGTNSSGKVRAFAGEGGESVEQSYEGRKVVVVGAARSGAAASALLIARGARVTLTDARGPAELARHLEPLSGMEERLTLRLGGHDPCILEECGLVVVSPGVPLSLPFFEECRKRRLPVVAEVELASRHLKGRILGVTGSNGKTTTTILAAEFLRGAGLRARAAGNVGQALCGFVEASAPGDLWVTELSSFQLEGIIDLRPAVAAVLNITPDHMDRYAGMADYVAAKERILMNQQPEDFALFNADDPACRGMARRSRGTPVCFSRLSEPACGAFLRGDRIFWRFGDRERELFAVCDIPLRGQHNLENVLAASAIALLAGAAAESLRGTVRGFGGVEHRLERVAGIAGVDFFNDSKATNVDSAVKALESFPGGVLWIAGGRDKGGDFTPLRRAAAGRVKRAVLIGEAAGKLDKALSGAVETVRAASLSEAVSACFGAAARGDVVLLAPACASFDMFENYEHRGRVFKQAVHELARSLEPSGESGIEA